MSADNAIMILKTPKNNSFEYRVSHVIGPDYYQMDDDGNYTTDPKIMIKNVRETWNNKEVFTELNKAYKEAQRLTDDIGYTEYGIIEVMINEEF